MRARALWVLARTQAFAPSEIVFYTHQIHTGIYTSLHSAQTNLHMYCTYSLYMQYYQLGCQQVLFLKSFNLKQFLHVPNFINFLVVFINKSLEKEALWTKNLHLRGLFICLFCPFEILVSLQIYQQGSRKDSVRQKRSSTSPVLYNYLIAIIHKFEMVSIL